MKLAAVCVVLLACQTSEKAAPAPPPAPEITAASCRPFLVKARFLLEEMGTKSGMPYTQSIEEGAIKQCEADIAAGRPVTLMKCVLAAKTTEDVRTCFPTLEQVKPS